MIAVILRLILLLIPVVALVMWIRWRMRTDRTEEELAADFARMRWSLIVLVLAAAAAGISLRLLDDQRGDPRSTYIPPHTEDGKVVPGRFKPADETDEADETGGKKNGNEGDGGDEGGEQD
jgi:hypothetical protein